MSDATWRETFTIGADHPALPGHFPGRPIVPGVVLLDRVAAALQRWRGQTIGGLPQVKFLAPLLPGETAELHLEATPTRVRFRILRGAEPLAGGEIEPA